MGYTVCVATTQRFCCGITAAIDNMEMNEHDCSNKILFKGRLDFTYGPSLDNPVLSLSHFNTEQMIVSLLDLSVSKDGLYTSHDNI